MLDSIAFVQPILDAIVAAGGRPQIVGGAVRDLLRGEPVEEVDLEVYNLPIEELIELLTRFGRVDAVGRSFGVLKLRLPGGREIDVALPRRESKIGAGHRGFLAAPDPTMTPREAAARRDFTWNALALTHQDELLDFFGGQADLNAGVVRHTTAAFAEDPLRVLRAMQLAARLDMRLAPETAELGRALLPEAATLAVERVWAEWQKWALKGVNPVAGLAVLVETGWIELYPELAALIGCPQDSAWHPEGWSLVELPVEARFTGPTQPSSIDSRTPSTSFREFVMSTPAAPPMIPGRSSAPGTQTSMEAMFDCISVTDAARSDNLDAPSPLGPTVVTHSEGLVWTFGTAAISADEVIGVVFKVPLDYVKSIMLAAIDDFEVVRRIIHPVAIYVMNMLPSFQATTQLQFHNDAVNSDSTVFLRPGCVHVPTIVVNARTASVDGDVFFYFHLAAVGNSDVAHVFDYSTRFRVFHVAMGDVWTHTLHVCNAAARIAEREQLAGEERIVLLLAALCHDLGKPATTGIGKHGRIRSPGHARAGVAPARTLLARIGCPRAVTEQVTRLVDEHMAHLGAELTPRTVRRLAVRLAPATLVQWERLVEADHSGRPPLPPAAPGAPFLALAEQVGAAHGRPAPIVQGRHLIAAGVAPGAALGRLLQRAYAAQIDGVFSDAEAGVAWLMRQEQIENND